MGTGLRHRSYHWRGFRPISHVALDILDQSAFLHPWIYHFAFLSAAEQKTWIDMDTAWELQLVWRLLTDRFSD